MWADQPPVRAQVLRPAHPAAAAPIANDTQEITVTARRRPESSERVPISMSIKQGDELAAAFELRAHAGWILGAIAHAEAIETAERAVVLLAPPTTAGRFEGERARRRQVQFSGAIVELPVVRDRQAVEVFDRRGRSRCGQCAEWVFCANRL